MIKNGYTLNPDSDHVREILKSLAIMNEKFGKRYCPCRPIRSDENVCPCVPFKEEGDCVCKLYVKGHYERVKDIVE